MVSNFREFISREMLFGAKTMFKISFSYVKPHFEHIGPGFDRLDRQEMVLRFYCLISMEMMIGAKTLFMISFSYIKLHVDNTGPGFDGFFQQKMVFRFYWSNFHIFISMEMMFGAKTMLDMDIHI